MDKAPELHVTKHFVFAVCHLSSQLEVKHPFSFSLLALMLFALLLVHAPVVEVYVVQGHQGLQNINKTGI